MNEELLEKYVKINDLDQKWKDVLGCKEIIESSNRLTKDEYGCLIALSVSSRSEDPHTKAGCCVCNNEGRILSTGYNGLINNKSLPSILQDEEYRDIKRNIFIHAETNALSLIKKGEAETIYLNMNPCSNCSVNIAAHGIMKVVFVYDYPKSQEYKYIFDFYNILYRKISDAEKNNINNFIKYCVFIG